MNGRLVPQDGDPEHLRAYDHAYVLMEALQSGGDPAAVAGPLRRAVDRGWRDVQTLLHYALVLGARQNGTDAVPHLREMQRLTTDGDDPALRALTWATTAEWPLPPDSDVEQGEADLARAVALLHTGAGAVVERPVAFIACALAYHSRGFWELEEELYESAAASAAAIPADQQEHRARSLQIVLFNQREALLSTACARWEVGDHDGARSAARSGLAVPRPDTAVVPACWVAEADAAAAVLAALLGEPAPDVWPDDACAESWTGYRGLLLLAEAVRTQDAATAATLAEQALPLFTPNLVPAARDLALAIAARRPPRHPQALRYAEEQLQWRWQSRLNLIGSARARIEAARQQLDYERLTERAYLDQLTGLANRHATTRYLDRLRQDPQERQVAVLVLDLDRFKQINDGFGHLVGDHVLKEVSAVLADAIRPTDLAARLGGDEFLLVLDGIAADDARQRAEHLVRAVAGRPWPDLAPALAVTVTVGVCTGPGQRVDDLIAAADRNLYAAKGQQRGTVGVTPEPALHPVPQQVPQQVAGGDGWR